MKTNQHARLRIRETPRKVLGYSKPFKKLVRTKKGILSRTHQLINAHFEQLSHNRPIAEEETGIRIQKAATGTYKGGVQLLTLKVTVDGREFFVKITDPTKRIGITHDNQYLTASARQILQGTLRVQEYLKKKAFRFDGFNVRVIRPELIFEDKSTSRTFFVTKFFNEGDVIQCGDVPRETGIRTALYRLGKETAESGVETIGPENAFYHPKTKTILLYDLHQTKTD